MYANNAKEESKTNKLLAAAEKQFFKKIGPSIAISTAIRQFIVTPFCANHVSDVIKLQRLVFRV